MKYTQRITQFIQSRLPVITLVAALLAIILPFAVSAWGPDRVEFRTNSPATYVTFNSMVNNPAHGDERNFMQIREATASNETYSDTVSLQPGKEYVVYMYYHNNAASNYNASGVGVAQGAFVRAEIPSIVKNGGAGVKGVGHVGATNAKHLNTQGADMGNSVWDDIEFRNTSGGDIALRYVPGSATIHSKGAVNGRAMNDSIVSTGALIGYDALDGRLPGCHEYAGFVTFRVKADQPDFTVTKQVRKDGTSGWHNSVKDLKPGDTVQYLIGYRNTGSMQQNGIVVKDILPKGLTYVSGSSVLTNASNPNGRSIEDGVTSAGGIRIGDYAAGANAYVTFKAKVADTDAEQLVCGTNSLVNRVVIETQNGSKEATVPIEVLVKCQPGECKPGIPNGDPRCEAEPCVPKDGETVNKDGECVPAALPTTGPAQIIAGILGVALVALGFAYWIRSRKAYKQALAGFTEDFTEEPRDHLLEARADRNHHDGHADNFHNRY